jgi:membrane protease YdiL (CAAX protease family)
MAPGSIKLVTVGFSLGLIALTEISAYLIVQHFGMVPLYAIGLVRLIQIGGILAGVVYLQNSLAAIGWSPATWPKGMAWGALWSMAFGAVVAVVMGLLHLAGGNPLAMVRSPLPSEPVQTVLFFVIGGLIAPLAEEICFRGVLYNYFRRWGIATALIASTLLFVILHSVHGFPLTQLVGGIVFALSYEYSGNLMVPITIHAAGNLAIFTLSLPSFFG